MATQVQICNLALGRIGKTIPIASVDERSVEAMYLKSIWDVGRQFVLRAFVWPFASRIQFLTLIADLTAGDQTVPGWTPEWAYLYAYPFDCLFLDRVVVPQFCTPLRPFGWPLPSQAVVGPNFSGSRLVPILVADLPGTGRVLYANVNPAQACYVEDVTDPTRFDPIFASALAWWLASELAASIQNNAPLAERLRAAYDGEVSKAAARALSEGVEVPEPDSQFVRARL